MLVVSLLWLMLSRLARSANHTIDDTYGDARTGLRPRYEPETNWFPVTSGQNLDFRQVRSGTVHGADTAPVNVSLTFTGTRVYVFFVIYTISDTNFAFYLNGATQPSGRYFRKGDAVTPRYLYNQMVFKSDVLPEAQHSLIVQIGLAYSFFDYAVYSTEEQESLSTPTHPHSSTRSPTPHTPDRPTRSTEEASVSHPTHSSMPNLSTNTATATSGAIADDRSPQSARAHASVNIGALAGGCAAGVAVVAALCAWLFVRRGHRRRLRLRALDNFETLKLGHTNGPRDAITPFVSGPDVELPEPDPKNRKSRLLWVIRDAPPLDSDSGTGDTRDALQRARAEIERLRKAAEPPPYSDGAAPRGV